MKYCAMSLVPFPGPFMAGVDGTLVKTAKSSLLEVLEKELPAAENIPSDTAWVIDGMAVLQSFTSVPDTFANLAAAIFKIVTSTAPFLNGSSRIDFVTDQDPAHSMKR